ncbi:hypothetical protein BDN72DRAFT_899775 [Pluteus cervinus]|uniref:Uncharacterized protein n=1 Tax=Pluteus cervinus TaxID=181527 RepID=A0ACD3ALC5_9AGAR|nr:hypothetical protein BDN72DRAFT_899775 [Pluteus cervinus]
MPEAPECRISGLTARAFILEQQKEHPHNLVVHDILIDATDKVQEALQAEGRKHRARYGFVYSVPSDDTTQRGHSTTTVFPPLYATTQGTTTSIFTHGLTLRGSVLCGRCVILEFVDNEGRSYWLQIQLLKHTSLQIYTLECWQKRIYPISKALRGYKIAFAIQFAGHVMAFVSIDMLVNIHWAPSPLLLPWQKADVINDYVGFCSQLVNWIEHRRQTKSPRDGNATAVLRGNVGSEFFFIPFAGLGVYISSEVSFLAGFGPDLTEAELFDCPSRVARLVLAFWTVAHRTEEEIWPFTRSHMVGYVTAVHKTQRNDYSSFVHVYGKDRVNMPARLDTLVDNYNNYLTVHQFDSRPPFDAFEPLYVKHALLTLGLGPIVFGSAAAWESICEANGLAVPELTPENPLVSFLTSFSASPTSLKPHLDIDVYKVELFPKSRSDKWQETFLFRINEADFWSVTDHRWTGQYRTDEPDCTLILHERRMGRYVDTHQINGASRKQRLLSFKTQHTSVCAIGPLDFCGTADLVGCRGEYVLMVNKVDPGVSIFFVGRLHKFEATAKIRRKGTQKAVLAKKVQADIKIKISYQQKVASRTGQVKQKEEEGDSRPKKKMRLSVDQRLLLERGGQDPDPSTRTTRATRMRG